MKPAPRKRSSSDADFKAAKVVAEAPVQAGAAAVQVARMAGAYSSGGQMEQD